jgi:DNA-binding LacI/PurR family transcriptional regulator
MTTIHDVASRAGVSVATVSRWLAGHNVRAGEDVRRAVEELGYRPNASAQSLKTGRQGTIGVVVPDITNPFFAAVVKGLEKAIPNGSYRILLASSDESAEREAEVLADLEGRVDGFVLAPANEQDRAPLALHRAGVPVVLLDREVSGGEVHDVVLVDNVHGAAAAAEHLLSLGHRRIAMINGPDDTTPGRERRAGFTRALREAGVPDDPALDFTGDFREESGWTLANRMLDLVDTPTALFSANNQMTIGALKALRSRGVRIPDQLSVVGFDDLALGSLLEPPLTCVTRADEEQGELTMRLLLERLSEHAVTPPRRIVLDAHLEVRGSTAPPAKDGSGRTVPAPSSSSSSEPRKVSHE